jgi:hypothetical protein
VDKLLENLFLCIINLKVDINFYFMSKNKKIFLLIIFSFNVVILGGIFFNQNVLAISANECQVKGCQPNLEGGCDCPIIKTESATSSLSSWCKTKGCQPNLKGGCDCPTNELATSSLSSWCKTAYCGGCSQQECKSNEILPDLKLPINKICEWNNGFCVTKSKSDSNPKTNKQRNFIDYSFLELSSPSLEGTLNFNLNKNNTITNSNSTKAFGGGFYNFKEGTNNNFFTDLANGVNNLFSKEDVIDIKIKMPKQFICSRSSSSISAEQRVCQNAGCQWNSYVNLCICQTPETCAKNNCQWDSDNNICNCNNYKERCQNYGCSWVNGGCYCENSKACKDSGCQWENNKCICVDKKYYNNWDSDKKLYINKEKSDCLNKTNNDTYYYWDEYASNDKCQSINNYSSSNNCSSIPGCNNYNQDTNRCSCTDVKKESCLVQQQVRNDCVWDDLNNKCVCSFDECQAKGCQSDLKGGCNCSNYTFLQPLCGYKNPWFINNVEYYTISVNDNGKKANVCQYIVDNDDQKTGGCTAPGESDKVFPQLKTRPLFFPSTQSILTRFNTPASFWSETELKGAALYQPQPSTSAIKAPILKGATLYWLSKSSINSFSANKTSIKKGEPVVISWDVDGALTTNVSINENNKNISYSSSDTGSIWDKIIKKVQGISVPDEPLLYDGGNGGGESGGVTKAYPKTAYQIYLYPNISKNGKIIKDTSGAYFVGNIGEKGSVTVYPDEDTVFYLGMKGVSGEGIVFLTSDPVKVRVMDGKIDLDVRKTLNVKETSDIKETADVKKISNVKEATDSKDSNYTDGPITIDEGEGIDLKWNGYNLSSCKVSSSPQNSSWTGSVSITGNKTIDGLTETTTFNIQCITNNNTLVSDYVVVYVNKKQAIIEVRAKLDGNEWSGPIEYYLSGSQSLKGSSAPEKFKVAINHLDIGDSYTLNYISGGPESASFKDISPLDTQIIYIGGVITFYINFETLNKTCTIDVSALYNDSPWEGDLMFTLSGPTFLSGSKVPSNYEKIPSGNYSLSYISGGPTSSEGKIVVYDGVVGGGSKICSSDIATQFVMKFVDQTSPTPTPFPPIAKINCRAEVVEDNYCSGTADGDSNTPTITLFSASTDPDGDIESCYWKIYNSENEIEKESDTCQPITFGDEVGTYRATLEVVDMAGNKDEDDYTFEVKRQQTELIADFSWEPAIPIVTKQVDFFDRSIVLEGDSITKWSWSFEDATPATSKEQNPTGVIFNTSGPKSVTLTITTSSGMKETVTKTINVRSINPEWEEVIPK